MTGDAAAGGAGGSISVSGRTIRFATGGDITVAAVDQPLPRAEHFHCRVAKASERAVALYSSDPPMREPLVKAGC